MSRQPSRAVMEARAPAAVEADDAQTALYRALDYFPTPPWAARAGGEVLRRLDPHACYVREPACGQGHMAEPLSETFKVDASDIHAHGYGRVEDFLAPRPADWEPGQKTCHWVVTNPPFKHLAAFVERGLEDANIGVALLLRTAAVETEGRSDLMRRLSLEMTFSERVSMRLGRWDPDHSFATTYSWFFWMHPAAEKFSPLSPAIEAARAQGLWLHGLIPPGTKARLWKADDVRRFAPAAPAPLFDKVEL